MARIVSACLQQLRGCPAPLLESADNCHPAALRQRLPGVAGLSCLDEPEGGYDVTSATLWPSDVMFHAPWDGEYST